MLQAGMNPDELLIENYFGEVDGSLLTASQHASVASRCASFRGQTRTKKADISWIPTKMPNGRSRKWPTLVGEVTCSERHTKLKEEIEFWINKSDSSVNAPITISVLRDKIMVESWKGNDNMPPSPNQKIKIVRNPHPGCPRVNGS
ncbi:unnamed protein product [Penicillium salamii]|uniref:Uncharacterized protein n=1 Tax=Penicillium salamii TaxID=1612424 RepID=A0A9W4IS99_9EURO|nr:unnamed protein product [Penicillium salamii]CAG8024923.1 unnamed protein product [Penicillium salamii]CAG8083145.1 unnamed protein product [Penicillium salamii]CAG8117789.1 unnamed protein product [Penicillium salamii]CAG8184407.1 unnamed protein product [Penicillium salamii]